MDLVENPKPGDLPTEELPSTQKKQDPFDTRIYGKDVQAVIDYIQKLKESGRNLPPVDLGPGWRRMSIDDYLRDFVGKYKKELDAEANKTVNENIEIAKLEISRANILLNDNQINLNIANEGNNQALIKLLKEQREQLFQELDLLYKNIENLEKYRDSDKQQDIALDPIFQEQFKNSLRDSSFYRSGNVTFIVPAEYRHRPEKIQEMAKLVDRLQQEYGTETPIEVNLYTRSPGDVSNEKLGRELSIWSVGGWATQSNNAGAILIGIDGQRILTDVKLTQLGNWTMPASKQIPSQLYTLAHEWGHAREFSSTKDDEPMFSGMSQKIADYFAAHPEVYMSLVSEYGRSATWEATAELFAQMFSQETFYIDKVNIPQEILDILKQ